jgi:hypothetical protein
MSMDASIRNWKGTVPIETGYPDSWPGWTSPDVFVDNNGNRAATSTTAPHTTGPFKYYLNVNEPGEPSIGSADNRLFLVIRNLGGSPASGVQVSVQFAPISTAGGAWVTTAHFRQIDQFSVDLGSSGTADGEKELEVQWDLSDVTDTNGGLWPYPLGAFNHFCVQVQLTLAGDGDFSNNFAQSNFGNVISASPFPIIPMLVANSDPEPKTYELVAQQLPEKWGVRLRGLEKESEEERNEKAPRREDKAISHGGRVKFVLEAGEERFLTLAIIQPQEHSKERQLVTIGLAAEGKLVGGISFMAGPGNPPRRPARRTSECGSPILPHYPLPVFFPKKEVVLRYPVQLALPGTTLVRVAEQPK